MRRLEGYGGRSEPRAPAAISTPTTENLKTAVLAPSAQLKNACATKETRLLTAQTIAARDVQDKPRAGQTIGLLRARQTTPDKTRDVSVAQVSSVTLLVIIAKRNYRTPLWPLALRAETKLRRSNKMLEE